MSAKHREVHCTCMCTTDTNLMTNNGTLSLFVIVIITSVCFSDYYIFFEVVYNIYVDLFCMQGSSSLTRWTRSVVWPGSIILGTWEERGCNRASSRS